MLPTLKADGKATTVNVSDDLTLFFSYETCIGFRHKGETVARENPGFNGKPPSQTTYQHLAGVDGGSVEARKHRLPTAEFEAAFAKVIPKMPKKRAPRKPKPTREEVIFQVRIAEDAASGGEIVASQTGGNVEIV